MPVGVIDLRRPVAVPLEGTAPVGGIRIRIASLVRVSLFLLVVANLGRIPVLSSAGKEAPVLINDLILAGVLGAAAIVLLQRRRVRLDATALWGLAFASVGAFSAALALIKFDLTPFELLFSFAYLARWMAYFGLYLVVINFLSRNEVQPTWAALQSAVLIFAAFGIVQVAFLPGFAQIVYPESEAYVDWDIQGRRLVSTFLDPNFAGGLIAFTLLVLLAQLSTGGKVSRWKLLLLFAALILTISRSSFLALFVGGLLILAVKGLSRRLLRFGALVAVLLVPALPFIIQYAITFNKFSIDASALARVTSWVQAFRILADNPMLGVGFNTYGFVRGFYGSEGIGMSSFTLDGGLLFIAVMTGVVGVVLYTLMIASVLRRCRRVWRSDGRTPEERGFAIGVAAATVALIVHSFFLNSLLYPFLMQPFWILWGLTFALADGVRGEEGVKTPSTQPSALRPVLAPLRGHA